MNDDFRFGYVALAGRPNTGKSTLLNCLTGHKVSITSRKPQTTRHRILGIRTSSTSQIVFVDTPGLHASTGNALNRMINKTAQQSLVDVDVIVIVCSAQRWTSEDDWVMDRLRQFSTTMILAINKIDRLRDKRSLLPFIKQVNGKGVFEEIVPISAQKKLNIEELVKTIQAKLPIGSALFPQTQVTDQSETMFAAELIREQLFCQLGQELPYSSTVVIDRFSQDDKNLLRIEASVWVEKPGQKGIVIGQKGNRLKIIGEQARKQIEQILNTRVFLNIRVKVKQGWADNTATLRNLGFADLS